jgi:hypothetical protein
MKYLVVALNFIAVLKMKYLMIIATLMIEILIAYLKIVFMKAALTIENLTKTLMMGLFLILKVARVLILIKIPIIRVQFSLSN